MPRTTDARVKAIETAERLFRVQGYAATGLTQIIEESGSPKGSFYFHFPGGKRQLADETLAAFRARTVGVFTALAEKADSDPLIANTGQVIWRQKLLAISTRNGYGPRVRCTGSCLKQRAPSGKPMGG